MMDRRVRQNLLFSAVMTVLGMFFNIFHALVDRMALSVGRQAVEAGLYLSVYALGSLVSIVLSSALADREGKRRVVASGLVMMGLGFLVLYLARAEGFLLLGLFLFGFGFSPTEGMGSAIISDQNPRRGSLWMNIAHAGFGLGAILGPPLAMAYLMATGSFQGIFLGCALASLVFLALVLFSGREVRPPARSAGQRASLNMFSVLRDGSFRLLALTIFLYLGYESVSPSYIKQFFLATGANEDSAAMMISLFWATMITGRLLGARLTGREGRSIQGFALISVLGFALLVLASDQSLRVVAVGLIGLGCGPIWPMLVARAAQRFPDRSGAAIGMMMLSSMAGITFFPPVIGALPGNLKVTFTLCAVLAGLVSLAGLQLSRAKGRVPPNP